MSDRRREEALGYHQVSSHRVGRFAPARGFMDWSTQPDPFRRYRGAEVLPLPRPAPCPVPLWDDLAAGRWGPPRPLGRELVGDLFFHALALSAWKQVPGSRWSLRVHPSSGNLHPTEAWWIGPDLDDLPGGVYHYAAHEHALERRRPLDADAWQALAGDLPAGSALVAFSTLRWREAWKYGVRAFRYCELDLGHARAALGLAAGLSGRRAWPLSGVPDEGLARLLGVDDQVGPEREEPDVLLALVPADQVPSAASLQARRVEGQVLARLEAQPARGDPSRLSPEHYPWPAIDRVAGASARRAGDRAAPPLVAQAASTGTPPRPLGARALVRARRSAVRFDGRTGMAAAAFWRLIGRLAPGACPALSALEGPAGVHVLYLVHRVEGVEPGLLLQLRDPGDEADLRAALDPGFAWDPVADAPHTFRLRGGDLRRQAQAISCDQAIAADGAVAVVFLARFRAELEAWGAPAYRRLHQEAGALGHLLYLEAEAANLRGTGIGCFFDPETHAFLGLEEDSFRDLYHFTLGGPVDDPRVEARPAYEHLGPGA